MKKTESRIDRLRRRLAAIGQLQEQYYRFFPSFEEQLVRGFGEYLGDIHAVDILRKGGAFEGEHPEEPADPPDPINRAEGSRIVHGSYRFFLLVRLENLRDNGAAFIRLRLACTLRDERVSVVIQDKRPVRTRMDEIDDELYHTLHACLEEATSEETWFEPGMGLIGFTS